MSMEAAVRKLVAGFSGRILELGTRRSQPHVSTQHKYLAPHAEWVLADLQPGLDVDVVADAHTLTQTFATASFDAVLAYAVFEHVQRPWIAAKEIAAVLKPGGIVYVGTHQTFPLHGYPNDYWRFSTEALRTIFEDAGLETVDAQYSHRCYIVSFGGYQDIMRPRHPSFIHVEILSRKP